MMGSDANEGKITKNLLAKRTDFITADEFSL